MALAATPPARGGAPVASPYEATLIAYAQLDPAQQRSYVERLVRQRLEPAARLVLSDDELARQQNIDAAILTRLADGERISPRGLVKLLRKLDTLEQQSVERLARQYRVEAYSLFHSQKSEYERRVAVWKRVEAAWVAAGSVPAERQLLIAWLQTATARVGADPDARLPAIPRFAAAPVSTTPAVAATGNPSERVELHPTPAASAARRIQSQLPDLAHQRPAMPAQGPASELAAAAVPATRPVSPAIEQRADARLPAPVTGVLSESLTGPTGPALPLGKTAPEMHLALRPIDHPELPPKLAPPSAVQALPAAAQPKPAPNDPASAGPQLEVAGNRPGQIDLDELAVRIAGHKLALARLAGRLQGREAWTVPQLTDAVTELEELAARRADLLLYWNLVADAHRAEVGNLERPDAAVTLLNRKVYLVRELLMSQSGDPPTAAQAEPLLELDMLSRRLAQIDHEL